MPWTNVLDLTSTIATQYGLAEFGAPVLLDLDGRSIRELRRNEYGEYLVLAGSTPQNDTWALYTWDGQPGSEAVFNRGLPQPDLTAGGGWEGIVSVPHPLVEGAEVRLVGDSGDTVYYPGLGQGKDLPQPLMKSYSQVVALGPVEGPEPVEPVEVTGTVASSAGGPVAQPCAYLYASPEAESAAYASCGQASGEFGIREVAPGSYTLAVADPSGAHLTWWSSEPVVIGPDPAPLAVTLQAVEDGSLSGAVSDGSTPLAGVCTFVYEHGDGSAARYATCGGAEGDYWLGGIDAGGYDVAFFDPSGTARTQWWTGADGGAATQAEAAAVQVAAGAEVTGIDAVMVATTEVSGTVTGPGGPIADACVYLYDDPGASSARHATCTAGDGGYWLGDVAPGDYTLAVADPSGAHQTRWQELSVAGPTTADVSLDAATGGITGTVTGTGGTPVGGACVYLYPAGSGVSAAYASCAQLDGGYRVAEVGGGDYDVAFFDPAGDHATQWWTGSPGGAGSQAGATALTVASAMLAGIDAVLEPVG